MWSAFLACCFSGSLYNMCSSSDFTLAFFPGYSRLKSSAASNSSTPYLSSFSCRPHFIDNVFLLFLSFNQLLHKWFFCTRFRLLSLFHMHVLSTSAAFRSLYLRA
ncbi:unnamed protein product [Ceratitis capitata]|uniref:(Mediterranean fruit fly) hypothetical protein n=1 Tax=Ceratitis capitata TaxID=7213 RepID=A0A811V4N4_CERCA|nr:unnamed protein product [Ceratitis capitata]